MADIEPLPTSRLDEAFWRLRTVEERTGLGHSTIDRMERAGKFPPRRRIGDTAVAWLASEVIAWMHTRPVATANQVPQRPAARGRDAETVPLSPQREPGAQKA